MVNTPGRKQHFETEKIMVFESFLYSNDNTIKQFTLDFSDETTSGAVRREGMIRICQQKHFMIIADKYVYGLRNYFLINKTRE